MTFIEGCPDGRSQDLTLLLKVNSARNTRLTTTFQHFDFALAVN